MARATELVLMSHTSYGLDAPLATSYTSCTSSSLFACKFLDSLLRNSNRLPLSMKGMTMEGPNDFCDVLSDCGGFMHTPSSDIT